MEPPPTSTAQVVDMSKRLARRLLTIGENRFELFMVEVQEERERLLRAILLALGVAALGLLAGMVLTGTIVALVWALSRGAAVMALLALTALYGAMAVCLYRRLTLLLRTWQNFPATLDQLRKDRQCLEKSPT